MKDKKVIARRKLEHLNLCAQEDVQFKGKTTMLEDVEFVHCALPDLSEEDLDTSTSYMNKRLAFPLIITSMTGGIEEAKKINRALAKIAQRRGIGFGVGSQRLMLRDPSLSHTFQVREVAPDILLFGNIGLAQAIQSEPADMQRLLEDIDADALCVHVNVAMELIQDHGDRNFRGGIEAIRRLSEALRRPLIVKETGCGFSREVGRKLKDIGIKYIDVAGAGGTSWVGIETLRGSKAKPVAGGDASEHDIGALFWDWGIPTAASLCELREFKFELIASGGIRHGLDIARALALGAQCAGVAQPIIRAYLQEGERGVEAYLNALYRGFKMAMLLTGSRTCGELRKNKALIKGNLREWLDARGLNIT